ncbi:MAG: GTP 3',8-cyclase MoaA [Candidatus Omnitrophica bacterium]|nr:GTP 3',8-cyclase MoaA [Candidatus Omnitrophota bacterium]
MEKERLVDSYGRQIDYLRISLTDLCNFRCIYCTPAETLPLVPPAQYLTRQEILRFVRIAGGLGIYRVRLTGGEPLLRKDILEIVKALKDVETVRDLSITTNGSRLKPFLKPLKKAGLDRLNISLDSMEVSRFEEVTRVKAYQEVMDSVLAALQLGFPVKLNMVVLKGLREDEIIRYVNLAKNHPLDVRFLEFMPLCGTGWRPDLVLPISEVRSIVHEKFNLIPLPRGKNVAEEYQIGDGMGKVGFIASLTESFCNECSRIRLSSDGLIQPCLFSDKQVSVKDLLRSGATDGAIEEAIRYAASIKPKGNYFLDEPFTGHEKDLEKYAKTPLIRSIGG